MVSSFHVRAAAHDEARWTEYPACKFAPNAIVRVKGRRLVFRLAIAPRDRRERLAIMTWDGRRTLPWGGWAWGDAQDLRASAEIAGARGDADRRRGLRLDRTPQKTPPQIPARLITRARSGVWLRTSLLRLVVRCPSRTALAVRRLEGRQLAPWVTSVSPSSARSRASSRARRCSRLRRRRQG